MAMRGRRIYLRLGGMVLAAVLSGLAIVAGTEATATPGPFPQAPADLPTEEEMQDKLDNLQGFMRHVDQYAHDIQVATEAYRRYAEHLKQLLELLAICTKVESDVSGFENTESANRVADLMVDEVRQCRGWVEDLNQEAKAYAVKLDEAVKFQELVQDIGERVQNQIDRTKIAMRTKQLGNAVDEAQETLGEMHRSLKLWVDQ